MPESDSALWVSYACYVDCHDLCWRLTNDKLIKPGTCECPCHTTPSEDVVPKAPNVQAPADTLPETVQALLESPEQMEWWMSSRPLGDLTPESEWTEKTYAILLFEFLKERVPNPDRLIKIVRSMGAEYLIYKNPNKNGPDRNVQLRPQWTRDFKYHVPGDLQQGQVPYHKYHRWFVAYVEQVKQAKTEND